MVPFEKGRISPLEQREAASQAAWEELVRRYGRLLHGQVCRSLKTVGIPAQPELVEERVQEVYCRLLAGGPGPQRLLRRWSEGQAVRYLSRIAQRVVFDELRKRGAVKRGGRIGVSFAGCLREVAERMADPRGTPEDLAMRAEGRRLILERCRRITQAMMASPTERGRCLRILRLAILEGWSSTEIVRAEGGRVAASTIDTLVHRVRRRLSRNGLEMPGRRWNPAR